MLGSSASHGPNVSPIGAAGRFADAAMASNAPFERVVERLEEIVDQETAALKARVVVDLNDFSNRKSQGLLDLNRALRGLEGRTGKTVLARLAGLRVKLEANQAALKTHLEAVREVASVLSDAIRDSESDGTYTPAIRGYGSDV